MATDPIFFGNAQESGNSKLAGASPLAVNVVIDGRGVVRRRPGVVAFSGLIDTAVDASGISGVFSAESGTIFAVGSTPNQRAIYRCNASSAALLASLLNGTGRPVFAETDALVVIAGGLDMQKIDLLTGQASLLGGSPPQATHVVANALRLLANDASVDRSKVRYSDISQGTTDYSGHETWSFGGAGVSGFFTAEARPDPVAALAENTGDVFVFGSSGVQVYSPDGGSIYAPVGSREYGCSAPYSVVRYDQSFAWLDHRRRIIRSDGRSYDVLSEGIQQTLDDMSTVSDCHGYRFHEGPVDCLVWTFPTDGRTFAYQIGGGWSQWQGIGPAGFMVTAHCHDRATNTNIVGTSSGYLGKLALGQTTDLGDDIAAVVETGFIDRKTTNRKWCQCVRLVLERGTTSSSTAPVGFLRYRDEPGEWSSPMTIDFGSIGKRTCEVEIRGLGEYRRRAWRFEFSGAADLELVRVSEDYLDLGQ
jgi:hypothetical protein